MFAGFGYCYLGYLMLCTICKRIMLTMSEFSMIFLIIFRLPYTKCAFVTDAKFMLSWDDLTRIKGEMDVQIK